MCYVEEKNKTKKKLTISKGGVLLIIAFVDLLVAI